MKSIMFVCTGNICRSIAAHAYMQYKVNKLCKSNFFLISSCGTNALNNEKPAEDNIEIMKEFGIDISKYRSTNIQKSNIEDYDLILCMTIMQRDFVVTKYKCLQGKVFTLKEYVDSNIEYLDIDDPWGYGKNVYKSTNTIIIKYIDMLFEKLIKE